MKSFPPFFHGDRYTIPNAVFLYPNVRSAQNGEHSFARAKAEESPPVQDEKMQKTEIQPENPAFFGS